MELRRVVNCLKLLNWETYLPEGCPVDDWSERFVSRGAERLPDRMPGLTRLRWKGHEVLVVERSGRVAIRLDVDTPHPERRHAAERVFQMIVDVTRRPGP